MGKTVALVLTSGGARGLAHIGTIEELLSRGYEIKAVAGSSMGAVIGGLYAFDQLQLYKEWMLSLSRTDVYTLFDFTFSSQGLIKGELVFETMQELMDDRLIESSPIPLCIVAADIKTVKEVWFTEGSLFKALRASVAIPSIVTPLRYKNMILVDGGVSNPMPIDAVVHHNVDHIIVSNCYADVPYDKEEYHPKEPTLEEEQQHQTYLDYWRAQWTRYFPVASKAKKVESLGYFSIISKSVEITSNKLVNLSMEKHKPHAVVSIPRDVCGLFEFYKANEVIEAGRRACKKTLDELNL